MFQDRCVPELNIHAIRLRFRTSVSYLPDWGGRRRAWRGCPAAEGPLIQRWLSWSWNTWRFEQNIAEIVLFICVGVLHRTGFCTIITPGASLCSWTGELTPAPGTGKSSSASLSFRVIIIIIIFIINTIITCHPASGSSQEADWVQAEIIQMSIQIKPRLISHQEMLKIINTNWHFSLDFFC